MLQLGIMRLQRKEKYMQIERVPDGKIDMDYVIYRLQEISKNEGSTYIKTVLLDKFIDELLATLGREGGDTFQKPLLIHKKPTYQSPDVRNSLLKY